MTFFHTKLQRVQNHRFFMVRGSECRHLVISDNELFDKICDKINPNLGGIFRGPF